MMVGFERMVDRAYKYLQAANVVVDSDNSAPAIFLIGHTLELSLKAFLLRFVCDDNIITYEKLNLKHDLYKIFERAKSANQHPDIFSDPKLDFLIKNYTEVYPNDVRYPETARHTQNFGLLEDVMMGYISNETEVDLIFPADALCFTKNLLDKIVQLGHVTETLYELGTHNA